jgi:hypothetical protein
MAIVPIVLLMATTARAAPNEGSEGTASTNDPPDADSQPTPPGGAPPTTARLTGEVGGGAARPSPAIAATGFLYQKVLGRWSPTQSVDLVGLLRMTEDLAGSSRAGSFRSSGDLVGYAEVDTNVDITDHVSCGLGLNGSPPSTREVATTLRATTARGIATDENTLIRARNSSVGALAEIGYDSFDEKVPHDIDVALEGSVAGTRFVTNQSVSGVEGQLPATSDAAVWASLLQVRTGGTVTVTIHDDTDVAVDGAYFIYDTKDPGNVGLFDVTAGGATTSFGAGVPMLPPRWSARPEIGRRFGSLSLRAFYQYSNLAIDGAYGHTGGGKVQVSFGNLKVYATGSYRTDIFPDATAQTSMAGVGITGKL